MSTESTARGVFVASARLWAFVSGDVPTRLARSVPETEQLRAALGILEDVRRARSAAVTGAGAMLLVFARSNIKGAISHLQHDRRGAAESLALLAANNIGDAIRALDLPRSPLFVQAASLSGVICPDCLNGERRRRSACTYCRGAGRIER